MSLEEAARIREEIRKLRQRTARAERSTEQFQDKAGRLGERVRRLTEENKKLKEEKADLEEEIATLKAQGSKLTAMLFKKNAKIPSMPSMESKKKRGAQPGHTGHGKKNPLEIDEEKNVHLTHCPTCENSLNESDTTYTRIVQDIPVPKAITTKYLIERQWCVHCEKEVSAVPENTLPFAHIGLRAIILIAFLKYRLRTPLEKIAELLKSHHGVTLSQGGIQKLLHRLSQKFTPEYEQILKEIRASPVKHADETTWRILGQNGWCWLFATPKAALYTIESSRGKSIPDRILGPNPEGSLVRDDYPGYAYLKTMAHQSCWAHLLRVSHETREQPSASEEVKDLHEELKTLFGELQTIVMGSFQADERERLHADYAKRLREIEGRSYEYKDAQKIQTRIKHQGNNLLTALIHENVPLTNNHAERQIRPMAIIRKISGGSRSTAGAMIQAVNMTIMQTIALKGQEYVTEIQKLLAGPGQRLVLERGE